MGFTDDLSDQFFQGVVDICGQIGCDPLDMLGVMMAESQVRPDSHNTTSNASGLIQFLPSTLAHLGWNDSPEAFRALSAEDQLPFVLRYFQPYAHFGLNTPARVYQVVFLPASLSLGSSPDTVLIQRGGANGNSYAGNSGLDTNHDGRITVDELEQALARHQAGGRWQEIVSRLNGGNVSDGSSQSDNSHTGAQGGQINLGTQSGIAAALDALGFSAQEFSFADAVRAYQQQAGLQADGVAGPKTRASLAADLRDNNIAFIG